MSKKYNKKNNMKQAMYEMFGVGEDQAEAAVQPEEEIVETVASGAAPEVAAEPEITFDTMMAEYEPAPKAPASYFAPGTVFEGTLKAKGDVEIAGEFNGDVSSEGKVILSSVVRGNVAGTDLELHGCSLEGDVVVKGVVQIGEDSSVRGNITAKEVRCAGQITGDLNVAGDTALESTAMVNGIITTDTMSMAKGAVIKGGIEMNASTRGKANK